MARALPEHVRTNAEEQCRNRVGSNWMPCILYKGHRFDGSKIRCRASPPDDPAHANNLEVTCQACFGAYKLVRKRVSLHGYKRPGYGFIMGRCLGAQAEPYEVSCEVTKRMLEQVELYMGRQASELQKLRAGPPMVQYTTKVFVGSSNTTRSEGGYKVVHLAIKKGEPEGVKDTKFPLPQEMHYHGDRRRAKGEPTPAHHPGYDRALQVAVRETERNRVEAKRQADDLREKIRTWKYVGYPGATTKEVA